MAKKRTKAQRSAAAKAAWERRRAEAEASNLKQTATETVASRTPIIEYAPAAAEPPVSATATKEGAEYFITIAVAGCVLRHKVSGPCLRQLGLTALQLVG